MFAEPELSEIERLTFVTVLSSPTEALETVPEPLRFKLSEPTNPVKVTFEGETVVLPS